MLSQLGCVTLDPEIVQAACIGKSLSPEDQAAFAAHPQVARDLLVNIPRLESIAWMISQQLANEPSPKEASVPDLPAGDIVRGARMLKLAVAFDSLMMSGASEKEAIARLRSRHTEFERELVDVLADMAPVGSKMEARKIAIARLTTGMILQQEIRTRTGMLLVGNGQEVTHALLIKLENLSQAGKIDKEILVLAPVQV